MNSVVLIHAEIGSWSTSDFDACPHNRRTADEQRMARQSINIRFLRTPSSMVSHGCEAVPKTVNHFIVMSCVESHAALNLFGSLFSGSEFFIRTT